MYIYMHVLTTYTHAHISHIHAHKSTQSTRKSNNTRPFTYFVVTCNGRRGISLGFEQLAHTREVASWSDKMQRLVALSVLVGGWLEILYCSCQYYTHTHTHIPRHTHHRIKCIDISLALDQLAHDRLMGPIHRGDMQRRVLLCGWEREEDITKVTYKQRSTHTHTPRNLSFTHTNTRMENTDAHILSGGSSLQIYIYSIYTYKHIWYRFYTYLHIYIYVYAYTHTHTYTHAHTYIYAYTYICINKHTCILYVHYVNIHTYMHTYIRTYIYTPIERDGERERQMHMYIHIYTHTHTHTHITVCVYT